MVGPKHGTTSPYRPSITIEVHDVDIGWLFRNALLQNFESLIHKWEQDAFDNFIVSQGSSRLGVVVTYITLNELRDLQ